MKNFMRAILYTFLILLLFPATEVMADQGKVVKVIDGDTFQAEIDGKSGKETIEINLKCSDAPVVGSLFGEESKQKLETLLGASDEFSYKVQAYCGSADCVVALVYIPDPEEQTVPYINTRMLEAGMARNDSCRGVFEQAEARAKSEKSGIWSTSQKIVFETVQKTVAKKTVKTVTPKPMQKEMAPAVVRYDRAERTVTLKSRKVPLTRVVKAIDAVSPSPINVYLQKENYLALNLEKIPWHEALRIVVETADLRQVNMDGKIDLYTRAFYYKNVAPYLKVAGNVGLYMNAGDRLPQDAFKDDGTTRYVFINEYENSAEVAQQYRAAKERVESSGFIQIHAGGGPTKATNQGTFELSGQTKNPVRVAAVDPVRKVVAPAPAKPASPQVERAALKPYSGEKVVADEEEKPAIIAAAPVQKPVEPAPVPKKEVPVKQSAVKSETKSVKPTEVVPEKKVIADKPAEVAINPVDEKAEKPGKEAVVATIVTETVQQQAEKTQPGTDTEPLKEVAKATGPAGSQPEIALEFSGFHAIALALIVLVVILGCVYLTRSAADKADEAEAHVEPNELVDPDEPLAIDADAQVDKAYEEEIFGQIDHVDDGEEDSNLEDSESLGDTVDEETVEEEAADEETDQPDEETVTDAEDETEELTSSDEDESEVDDENATEEALNELRTKLSAEGNFEVPVEQYHDAVHGPKREPRKICLFEVKCSLDSESFTGIGLDISTGGLFIDSKEWFDIGKVIELEFQLYEDVEESIRCRGAVTWYNQRPDPIKPDYPNGFGVRFLEIDEKIVAQIEEFLQPDEDDSPGFMDQISDKS